MHVDGDLSIAPGGALRFLDTVATALPGGHLHMRSIDRIDSHVGQRLSFRTLIAVRFGNVGELLDPVQVGFGSGTLFHANNGRNGAVLVTRGKTAAARR